MSERIVVIQAAQPAVVTIGTPGPQGPAGPQGPPGEVSGSIAWDNVTGKPSTFPPVIGSGAGDAVAGNDPRLSDARTPTAHKATHATGGIDALAPADIGAAATSHTHELAALNATGSTSGHVLTANGSGGAAWAAPAASGATNLWIPASAFIPRTTTGCGVDSRETTTNRQNFDELLFDAAANEFAQALVVLPNNYNLGTITARFAWTAASGSGDVVWGLQGRVFADDDALDTAHGTAQTVTDTLLAANDMHVTAATPAVTLGGTPAANRPIQLQIYRDAVAAGDTLAVDARLLGVEIIFN